MNHYNFDIRGHLQPSGVIQMTLSEFEDVFVASFEDSQTRLALFEEYKRYINDLQALLKSPFTQWIDGSFVNNRTRNPNDLDFVTIIDCEIYLVNEKAIDERFGKYGVKQFYHKLNAYTLRFYP